MNKMYDIILRYCGSVGWLGMVQEVGSEHELYRTGAHHQTREMVLQRCDEWIEKQKELLSQKF